MITQLLLNKSGSIDFDTFWSHLNKDHPILESYQEITRIFTLLKSFFLFLSLIPKDLLVSGHPESDKTASTVEKEGKVAYHVILPPSLYTIFYKMLLSSHAWDLVFPNFDTILYKILAQVSSSSSTERSELFELYQIKRIASSLQLLSLPQDNSAQTTSVGYSGSHHLSQEVVKRVISADFNELFDLSITALSESFGIIENASFLEKYESKKEESDEPDGETQVLLKQNKIQIVQLIPVLLLTSSIVDSFSTSEKVTRDRMRLKLWLTRVITQFAQKNQRYLVAAMLERLLLCLNLESSLMEQIKKIGYEDSQGDALEISIKLDAAKHFTLLEYNLFDRWIDSLRSDPSNIIPAVRVTLFEPIITNIFAWLTLISRESKVDDVTYLAESILMHILRNRMSYFKESLPSTIPITEDPESWHANESIVLQKAQWISCLPWLKLVYSGVEMKEIENKHLIPLESIISNIQVSI